MECLKRKKTTRIFGDVWGPLQGHTIRQGTAVLPDIHQIHTRDPNFEDAEAFRPERYLEEDGKTLRKVRHCSLNREYESQDLYDRTIPFGVGKRNCAGEGECLTGPES